MLTTERKPDYAKSERLADLLADEFEKRLPDSRATKDSLEKIVGSIRSDISDWADNHDKYLGDKLAQGL